MIYRFVILALACVISVCQADGVELDDLYSRSSMVALVSIIEAKSPSEGPVGCGFLYQARVIESFKGTKKGDVVQFRVRNSYFVGHQYLVFINSSIVPSGTVEFVMEDLVILDQKAEDCSVESTTNTISDLSSEIDYDAIFELRTITEIGEAGERLFLVGSGPALGMFGPETESYTFREHRPNKLFRGAILANDFLGYLRETSPRLPTVTGCFWPEAAPGLLD